MNLFLNLIFRLGNQLFACIHNDLLLYQGHTVQLETECDRKRAKMAYTSGNNRVVFAVEYRYRVYGDSVEWNEHRIMGFFFYFPSIATYSDNVENLRSHFTFSEE